MLTREQFLKNTDLRRETVDIEGLGAVRMRELSVGERIATAKKYADGGDEDRQALAWIALSLCEPDDSPMFGEHEIEQAVDALGSKAIRTIEALQTAWLKLNGLTADGIKEAVGNSTEIPSDDGSSASPEISDTQQPRLSAAS